MKIITRKKTNWNGLKKKCTVDGACKNIETNKTRMANCKSSWPFWLMMEVTDEVIGQWKWVMSQPKLMKHMLIIVTMNQKVKKDFKKKWAEIGQAPSVLECLYLEKLLFRDLFYEFLSGFLAAFLLGFQQVFCRFSCRLFCRYFADFDMKNEEIWQLLRKSESGITC